MRSTSADIRGRDDTKSVMVNKVLNGNFLDLEM